MAALSATAWLRSILVEDLAVLRPTEHQFQSQADQAQRLAERERQGLERLERRLERRLAVTAGAVHERPPDLHHPSKHAPLQLMKP